MPRTPTAAAHQQPACTAPQPASQPNLDPPRPSRTALPNPNQIEVGCRLRSDRLGVRATQLCPAPLYKQSLARLCPLFPPENPPPHALDRHCRRHRSRRPNLDASPPDATSTTDDLTPSFASTRRHRLQDPSSSRRPSRLPATIEPRRPRLHVASRFRLSPPPRNAVGESASLPTLRRYD